MWHTGIRCAGIGAARTSRTGIPFLVLEARPPPPTVAGRQIRLAARSRVSGIRIAQIRPARIRAPQIRAVRTRASGTPAARSRVKGTPVPGNPARTTPAPARQARRAPVSRTPVSPAPACRTPARKTSLRDTPARRTSTRLPRTWPGASRRGRPRCARTRERIQRRGRVATTCRGASTNPRVPAPSVSRRERTTPGTTPPPESLSPTSPPRPTANVINDWCPAAPIAITNGGGRTSGERPDGRAGAAGGRRGAGGRGEGRGRSSPGARRHGRPDRSGPRTAAGLEPGPSGARKFGTVHGLMYRNRKSRNVHHRHDPGKDQPMELVISFTSSHSRTSEGP